MPGTAIGEGWKSPQVIIALRGIIFGSGGTCDDVIGQVSGPFRSVCSVVTIFSLSIADTLSANRPL